MTKDQEDSKKELDRTGIDKVGSLEWLRRGQLNWDGEQIIINAQDLGHDALKQNSCQNSCTHKGTTRYIE